MTTGASAGTSQWTLTGNQDGFRSPVAESMQGRPLAPVTVAPRRRRAELSLIGWIRYLAEQERADRGPVPLWLILVGIVPCLKEVDDRQTGHRGKPRPKTARDSRSAP